MKRLSNWTQDHTLTRSFARSCTQTLSDTCLPTSITDWSLELPLPTLSLFPDACPQIAGSEQTVIINGRHFQSLFVWGFAPTNTLLPIWSVTPNFWLGLVSWYQSGLVLLSLSLGSTLSGFLLQFLLLFLPLECWSLLKHGVRSLPLSVLYLSLGNHIPVRGFEVLDVLLKYPDASASWIPSSSP